MDLENKSLTDTPTPAEFKEKDKEQKWEHKRKKWARWEFWTVVIGLPAGLIGIAFPAFDAFIRHPMDESKQDQRDAQLTGLVERTPAHITSDIRDQLAPLMKNTPHLTLSYASRPTDIIGENTALLTPNQPVLAQATADKNTPYLLEIDGTGAATLDTDAHFREKYGSKFKPNGQSWTIVALAADPNSLTADRIDQIQKKLSSDLTPLNLPAGRQITWTDTGWTWGKPTNTNGRSPDADSSLEVELSAHASAIESLLKTEFPNTPFLGRSFSVNSAGATSQPAGQ